MTDIRFKTLPDLNPGAGYSDLAIADGLAYVAGKVAADGADFQKPAGIEHETRMCMDLIGRTLALAGMGFSDIVKVTIFMKHLDDFERMNAVYRTYFAAERLPARTTVGVADIVLGCDMEIECIARVPQMFSR